MSAKARCGGLREKEERKAHCVLAEQEARSIPVNGVRIGPGKCEEPSVQLAPPPFTPAGRASNLSSSHSLRPLRPVLSCSMGREIKTSFDSIL